MLGGTTVIERVYRQVSRVLDLVAVATDDKRIADAVEAFGGRWVMTGEHHRSGTDRCREAYEKLGCDRPYVINIQGDEPFIDPSQLTALMACFDDPATDIATLVRPFDSNLPYERLEDPNTAKVVVDRQGHARYFSRSVIPYVRGVERGQWPGQVAYNIHIGLYGYRADILREITELPPSPLELAESLEQLRWIENGYVISTGVSDIQTIGIDTPDDLRQANDYLSRLAD